MEDGPIGQEFADLLGQHLQAHTLYVWVVKQYEDADLGER